MPTGGCFCGAIRYQADGPRSYQTICHCTMCRGTSGAPLVAWFTVPEGGLRVTQGTPVAFRSSPPAVRSFCGRCGTQLFFRHERAPGLVDVTIASLDDPEAVHPRDHTFVRSRLSWARFADGLPEHPTTRDASESSLDSEPPSGEARDGVGLDPSTEGVMGLLDDLVGSLTASDRNVSNDQASVLVQGVLESLTGGGQEAGIDGLSQRFQSAGLGDVISSWIGTGANKSVEPSALDRALRGSPLEAVTSRAGLGGIAGAAALAVLLPKLIDKLTPNGQVPPADRLREVASQAQASGPLRGPAAFAQAAESGGGGGGSKPKADFSKVRSGASSTAPPPAPAKEEQTYTVAKGDSLSKIAKKVYGDANQWKRIFEANRDQIENPDLIHPGQVLRIPN